MTAQQAQFNAASAICSSKNGQVYGSSYDSWGNVSQRSYGGVTATLSYDSLDHFTQWNGGSTNQEWYVYDGAGNRVLKRTTGTGATVLTSIAILQGDQGMSIYPFLFLQRDVPLSQRSRHPVSMYELWHLYLDFAEKLRNLPAGTPIQFIIE